MRVTHWAYRTYESTAFDDRQLIREFHRWRAWSARRNGRLVILLDEYERRRVAVCEYDDRGEFEADVEVLRTISPFPPRGPAPPSGGTSAQAFAWLPWPRRKPRPKPEPPEYEAAGIPKLGGRPVH